MDKPHTGSTTVETPDQLWAKGVLEAGYQTAYMRAR